MIFLLLLNLNNNFLKNVLESKMTKNLIETKAKFYNKIVRILFCIFEKKKKI